MVTRNREKLEKATGAVVFNGKKQPTCNDLRGRKLEGKIPQPLSSHLPISYWSLPVTEPNQKPESPESPLVQPTEPAEEAWRGALGVQLENSSGSFLLKKELGLA